MELGGDFPTVSSRPGGVHGMNYPAIREQGTSYVHIGYTLPQCRKQQLGGGGTHVIGNVVWIAAFQQDGVLKDI